MITVFGLGFVGLTTALGFAHYGYKVYGIDVNQDRKNTIKSGKLPFLEEGLDKALMDTLGKNFFVEDDAKMAIQDSEYIFYCVGTPYGKNGEADLTYLFSAIDETLKYANGKKLVLITKSTIPPSTTKEKIIPYIEEKGLLDGRDIFIANNPEFLREGHCWDDFIRADRIVVGCESETGIQKMEELYRPFCIPFYAVQLNTGEFIKYLSNTLLAMLISYSNEMSEIADTIGSIDIAKAFHILHMDKRWNGGDMSSYAYPGCGYGGYCLPKDTNALYAIAKNKGANPAILKEVIQTNDNMPEIIAHRIRRKVETDKTIGILGLSFKPNSDDVRDAASAKIIKQLQKMGYQKMIGYDPVANQEFEKYYHIDMEYADTAEQVIEKADVLIILTAWKEFKNLKEKTDKLILDYRYMDEENA